MVDWLTVIGTSIPWASLVGLLIYIFKNPEKAEKWYSIIMKVYSHFSERGELAHVASDIQSDINLFSKTISSEIDENILPYGIKIDWMKQTTRESFIEGDEVVVRMKHHNNQARNFLNASIAYVHSGLIPHARPHIDEKVLMSADFTVVKKILTEKKRHSALQIFYNEVLEPEIEKETNIDKYCKIMDGLDEEGLFDILLLRELSNLGIDVYSKTPSKEVKEETRRFVEFLEKIVTKKPGVDINPTFEGDRIRTSIVLIARPEVYWSKGIVPYLKWIRKCINKDIKSVYVCARGPLNTSIAKRVPIPLEESSEVRKISEKETKLPFYKGKRTNVICIVLTLIPKRTVGH